MKVNERPEFVPRRSRLREKKRTARAGQARTRRTKIRGGGEETVRLDYDTWPHESSELDGKEFLVYVKLRAWPRQKNELDCEPYKSYRITLCELIRRKRNDPEWRGSTRQSSRSG